MKYLLILSCLLFTSVSWSKDINSDDLVERDGLIYEKFNDVPFTGNVVGEIQGKVSQGKKVGEWLEYYEDGQLLLKRNYKDDKKEGEWLQYSESGQLIKKSNFKDGKADGEWLIYYESGALYSIGNYKDDKKEGEWLWYWESGKLKDKRNYKDDRLIKP